MTESSSHTSTSMAHRRYLEKESLRVLANPTKHDLAHRSLHSILLARERQRRNKGWWNAILNVREKTFLGRTATSWGKLLLFYAMFYLFLAVFFSIMIMGLYASLPMGDAPKYISEAAILRTPGLSVQPHGKILRKGDLPVSVINFSPKNFSTSASIIETLNDFTSQYEQIGNGNISYIACNDTIVLEDEVCAFDLNLLGPHCNSTQNWGYNSSSPCVLLKLNKIYAWQPDVYKTIDEAKEGADTKFPLELQPYMTAQKYKDGSLPEMIWIWCEGDYPLTIDYFPYPAFPGAFYPFTNQKGYISPLVALRIQNLPKNKIVLISCRVFVKNIKENFKTTHGTIQFPMKLESD